MEQPTTRVVVEFLLKQFGIRIEKNTKVSLCEKETCEIDADVPVTNYGANATREHFICCFSLDKERGIVPLIPYKEMRDKIATSVWPEAEVTIKDVIKECDIKPDFIITYGRLEMPNGISEMCWCVHEFIGSDGNGIFNGLKTVPKVVKLFTDYLWNLANLSKLSPEFVKKTCDEFDENAEPVEVADVFKVDDAIIYVLEQIPIETQRELFKRFCEKKPELESHLLEVDAWDAKHLRTFMLKYDVLNSFDEYREMMAEIMTQMMENEGFVEPINEDE